MTKRIDPQYLRCRDYGHTWKPWDAVIENKPRRVKRVLKCAECATLRTQTLDANYDVVGNSYRYPQGYQIPGRLTQADRQTVRARMLTLWPNKKKASTT